MLAAYGVYSAAALSLARGVGGHSSEDGDRSGDECGYDLGIYSD